MADRHIPEVRLSNIPNLIRENFEPGFVKAMRRDIPLLSRIKHDSFPGPEIRWQIHYEGTGAAGSYAETDRLPVADRQKTLRAAVPYKQNWVPVSVTGFAIATTKGRGGFVDILAFETKNALEDLKVAINQQLMVDKRSNMGKPDTDLDGLGCIIDDGQVDPTVTGYAGIDFATHPWWKPVVLANGGEERDLTIKLLQDLMRLLEMPRREAKVSTILCARVHYNQYGDLMASLRRFPPTATLDGGYPSLAFDQTKITAIPSLPAGSMYALQESSWGYYVSQNFKTEEKFIDADARYFIITHYSQLVCRELHKQGRIADLKTV